MAGPVKKPRVSDANASDGNDGRFPPEAYEYKDDVTPEGVAVIRNKAASGLGDEPWEVVDGFPCAIYD